MRVDIDRFSQQVAAVHHRVSLLLNNAEPLTQVTPKLTSTIFKELGWALEELQVCIEELEQQNQVLTDALQTSVQERKRYQDLFYLTSEARLVTNLEGIIEEANGVAAEMLGVAQQFLLRKPLSLFVCENDRQSFRIELIRRQQRDYFQEWEIRLQSRDKKIFDVACLTIANRNQTGEAISFHWTIKDITERKRIARIQRNGDGLNGEGKSLFEDRSLHFFYPGDLIPFQSQTVWYVMEGLVKLTTLTEQGQSVLIGLIGSGMPFGDELTSLPIYEAIALSDVQLICFSRAEIEASCHLTQLLLKGVSHRLSHTEELLALSGERQIETRLCRLLQLLKTEIGKPVEEGTCLNIRLTHEDLASACCTTRVTITRLFKKLQQECKITMDHKKHIVLRENFNN